MDAAGRWRPGDHRPAGQAALATAQSSVEGKPANRTLAVSLPPKGPRKGA